MHPSFQALRVVLVVGAAQTFAACSARDPEKAAPSPPPAAISSSVASRFATDTLAHDPDDPAIWISRRSPSVGLILGTDKVEATGGLYVFGLDGRLKQTVSPLDRPNNVDVEYGLALDGEEADIAVLTERKQRRLRVFRIRPDGGGLDDVSGPAGIPVLEGMSGDAAEPMGIALYKRQGDGAVFAIVAPKTGGTRDYLWQYRLKDDGKGVARGEFVRRFGNFSRKGGGPGEIGEIEALVVDDELGYVYYSDERFGIRKWHADPDHPDAGRELAVFGADGYLGDREGLAIYAQEGGKGFLVSSDQVPNRTRVHIYPREGGPAGPHDHPRVGTVETNADQTDGLDLVSSPVGDFPSGILVMMNSGSKNFLIFDWQDFARAGGMAIRTGKAGPSR